MANPFYRDLRARFEDVYRSALERGEQTVPLKENTISMFVTAKTMRIGD